MKDVAHKLEAVANEQGQIMLWVWTLGGVTKGGKDLEADPYRVAYPTRARAELAAKKLGPKVWAVLALFSVNAGRKVIKWAK